MKKTASKQKRNEAIFIICMLALPIFHFLVFWLYKNFSSIALAFQDELTGEWGFSNFERFFNQISKDWQADKGIKVCIENTFLTALQRMFVTTPLVVFASYVLFKRYFGHMFYRVVFYIPGIVGTVITATMLSYILDATGPIVKFGDLMGIQWGFDVLQTGLLGNNGSARITYFVTAMITVAGGTVLLLTGALQKIPQDLFDSMKLDGVGMFNEFIHLVVPCCWSTIGIMWIMTFANVWGDYSRVMLLTGGAYKTNNFAYYLFASTLSAINGKESYNYPAAIGLLLTAIIAPATLILRWLANKIVEPVEF